MERPTKPMALTAVLVCLAGCAQDADQAPDNMLGGEGAPQGVPAKIQPTAGGTAAPPTAGTNLPATAPPPDMPVAPGGRPPGTPAMPDEPAPPAAAPASPPSVTPEPDGEAPPADGPVASGPEMQPNACADDCPKQDGVDWLCKLRFMYGFNYAWHHFGGDFGGNAAWEQAGVSGNSGAIGAELAEMSARGVSVLRWWVFPDFRGDGVTLDGNDRPIGLGGTVAADVQRALELADQHDMYLMLTLFSFDNFRPSHDLSGLRVPGMQPIATQPELRRMLVDNVVRPFARIAEASPYADRVIAWDVINEPEWAMTGPGMYGSDAPFDPNPELQALTHAQMEAFVSDVIAGLRAESRALISVGGAAMKWRSAWSNVDVDFHQFHTYDWVNQYWPYTTSPAGYGIDDRPVVMGEFPAGGLAGADYGTLLQSWYSNGYGGALGWSFSDLEQFNGNLAAVQRFAERYACETRY